MKASQPGPPDEGHAQKVSVSMPASRIAAVRERAGARGFSSYVSAAVERQLQRDLIEELLQENEAKIGPIPQEIEDDVARAFVAADALAERELAEMSAPSRDEAAEETDTWRDRLAG